MRVNGQMLLRDGAGYPVPEIVLTHDDWAGNVPLDPNGNGNHMDSWWTERKTGVDRKINANDQGVTFDDAQQRIAWNQVVASEYYMLDSNNYDACKCEN